MKYKNIKEGIFKERPNRFIAYVEMDGKIEVCHVKNTGRCKELLIPGTKVYLEKSDNPKRKTLYDLVSVKKGKELFNIDSQAPNNVVCEWLNKKILFPDMTLIKSECFYKKSRFDFYLETPKEKCFVEVKGVTLEKEGVFSFPDAPTERGTRHLYELCECVKDGFSAYVIFLVQSEAVSYMTANRENDEKFYNALLTAKQSGVNIICLNSSVKIDSITAKDFVPVII